MRTARELGLADAVLARAQRVVVVASIGPVCSDALRRHGITVDLEPEHPKMGHLVVHPVSPRPHASRTLPVYVHLNGLAVWL
ncbi:MAG: uroporphyrinogen-III synthase [Solirubrobacteraceae bacterium]